jgi:DNA modification methylase
MLLPPPRTDAKHRRLLVPFSGAGSEMIGALFAKWDEVVGIEFDPEYIEIAKARLSYACAHPEEYAAAMEETDDEEQVAPEEGES